ncbi:sensor histidine kinase KdpD [Beijerinckia sp. L45]|uniref:sensor histidine kinase n=1 Tax=Beijerinckia sp. L45 TaxID=1641855 RepID=UPI00131BC17C|nr:sensor histidine kinase KdpD [Beijerinckia sp. L45]
MTDDHRPSPDALLHTAQREEKRSARLKIFLGAAPGVGKTYAMLQAAQAKRRDGIDVVVGIVETHGRAETQALLDGLETVPRQNITYKGRDIDEMDIDAILARRPALVLVDELAHTNAPGSRHPKRYLDVEELIAAGIDVYSTLNIQHVESLNTVIAQITRIRVRETVPDSVLDAADDIEAIDIAPDDLIQRLREGKVYVPRQAERALKHFFSPGNLTALRELTLRRTAQRVDEQLLTHMQSHAISGPWAAGERILVCVSEDPRSAALVRYAKRVADRLHASWTALYIETGRSLQFSEKQRDRIADVLRLAERLGADPITIPGGRYVADDIVGYARANNLTQIVVGKTRRSRWFELLNGSVVHDLVRRAGNISVHVIAGDDKDVAETGTKPMRPEPARAPLALSPYVVSLGMVAVALGAAKLIQPVFGVQNVDLVFLTAIVGVAVTFGLLPSLLAVVAASLAYNFFFLPPLYTFTIADPTNVAALFFFTLVAVLVSNLAARARNQAKVAQTRARITEALYGFSRKLGSCLTTDDVLWATAYQIASMLKVRVVMLLPEDGTLVLKAGYPPEDTLDNADLGAAQWAWGNNRPAGRGSDTLPGGKWLFAPMRTGRGPVGVVGLDRDKPGPLLTPEQRRLLESLLDQAALAIERVHLAEDVDRAKLAVETDRLRSALLTSISHDLKTPLASILGAASTLRDFSGAIDEDGKVGLIATVITESERLNRFIANLLDMTKLESGAITPNLALHDLSELIGAALHRAAVILRDHRVDVALAADLPMLMLDAVLFDQVLFNLLDNAGKYAADHSTISIQTWQDGSWALLQILDEGEGIPPGDLENVFEKFYRARKGDHVLAGTGLGLAISRGFVESMGGTITAGNRSDHAGAVFTLRLPVPIGQKTLDTAA